MPTTVKPRSILIRHTNGTQTLVEEIPGNAKITLGPLQPGSREFGPSKDVALRIYTTAGNQLAVFRDVASFRDLSLKVKVQEVKREANSSDKRGPKGSERNSSEIVVLDWVDEDAF